MMDINILVLPHLWDYDFLQSYFNPEDLSTTEDSAVEFSSFLEYLDRLGKKLDISLDRGFETILNDIVNEISKYFVIRGKSPELMFIHKFLLALNCYINPLAPLMLEFSAFVSKTVFNIEERDHVLNTQAAYSYLVKRIANRINALQD